MKEIFNTTKPLGTAEVLQILAVRPDSAAWARVLELHGLEIKKVARRVVREDGYNRRIISHG